MRFWMMLVVLVPSFVLAQDTRGTISGTVTDSQGASVAGSVVTVTNVGTGIDDKSSYEFERLL